MLYVQSHSAEEVAEALQPQFIDTDKETLITIVNRYKEQDSWKPDLVLTEEGLNHMMDIMEMAGQLQKRAPYDEMVITKFAEEAMKNIK